MAGEARSQPGACTEIANNNNVAVSYATVAVSSPLPSRSGRQLARSGSSAEGVLALSWWLVLATGPRSSSRALTTSSSARLGAGAAGVGRSSWCCRCSSSTRWLTFSCSSSSSSPGCTRAIHRQSAGHFSCAQRGYAQCKLVQKTVLGVDVPEISSDSSHSPEV